MIDREKAIEILSQYQNYCFGDSTYGGSISVPEIIELLKDQEPKAIWYHDNLFTGLPVAHCPNCMRYARQFDACVEEETHYCPWCGQAVKWND